MDVLFCIKKNLDQRIFFLKCLDLSVCTFHLLILLAIYIFTCSKLGKRKKSGGKLRDCKK